jgi:hypothetical protein
LIILIRKQMTKIPGALKHDQNKIPVFRGAVAYFSRAIEGIAAVSQFGATKYAWEGWRHVDDGINRYTDALIRHLMAEARGEYLDPESGRPHHDHVSWNACARAELIKAKQDERDE